MSTHPHFACLIIEGSLQQQKVIAKLRLSKNPANGDTQAANFDKILMLDKKHLILGVWVNLGGNRAASTWHQG